ncbi:MAG TPA: hypothetical protein VFI30_08205 [Nocardioidaceae bacterium]|nr:hypothetical protein [Nocardioidaceae bacterium]
MAARVTVLKTAALGGALLALTCLPMGFAGRARASSACALAASRTAPAVPAVTAQPGTSASAYQYAVAERTMFGLDASAAAVAAAAADPASTSDQIGTPVTPAEAAVLAAQDAVGRQVNDVNEAGAAADPEGFAGAWLDPVDRSSVDVGVVGGDCAVLQTLAGDFPALTLRGVQAAQGIGYARLQQAYQDLNDNLAALQAEGVVVDQVRPDIPADTVDVVLDASDPPSAESTVTAAAGGASGLTITGAGQPSTAAHSSFATERGVWGAELLHAGG